MKEVLRKILTFAIFAFSAILYKLSFFLKRANNVLILAPSWEGSKGDEAVISAASRELQETGHRVTLLHLGEKKEWAYLQTIDEWYSVAGCFSPRVWMARFKLSFLFSKNASFFLLGTDMLDGSYGEWLTNGLLQITHQAAFTGLKTNIVGISINTWQNKNCMEVMKGLPRSVKIGIRDHISLERISKLIPSRAFTATADIAFLLRPVVISPITQNYIDWAKNKKSEGAYIMVININPVSFHNDAETASFIKNLTATLSAVAEKSDKKIYFLLAPHDFRENRNDCELLRMLYDQLPDELKKNSLLMDVQITSEEIKAVVGHADFAVSSRMHMAVALVSQCIPTKCITYQPVKKQFTSYSEEVIAQIHQDKFDGLFKQFNLSGLTITPEAALQHKELNDFVSSLYSDKAGLGKQLKENLPAVLDKARLNLS